MNSKTLEDITALGEYPRSEIDKALKNHMTLFIKSLVPSQVPTGMIAGLINKPLTVQQEEMMYSIAVKIIALREKE